MNEHYFVDVDEKMIEDTLDNGLKVIMIPKENYHRVYSILTTNFGSLQLKIKDKETNEIFELPSGGAHFLEHKMFESENGEDAFVKFMHQGANANAFTSHFQTSYLFSASFGIKENIETLLDFVQTPYFTREGVEKEKGIIAQEIKMYLDQPGAKAYQALMGALYPNHPAGLDIAGTVESVQNTTYEELMLCYEAFYHPTQMCLVLVGNINPSEILELVRENQAKKNFQSLRYERIDEPIVESAIPKIDINYDVTEPIIAMGIRMDGNVPKGEELLKLNLVSEVFEEMLFGPTSKNAQKWYDKGWVDNSYSVSNVVQSPIHHFQLASSTQYPQEIHREWEKVILNWKEQEDLNTDHFNQVIKGKIGDLLQSFNTLEYTAYDIIDSVFNGYDYFNLLSYLKEMTFDDLIEYGETYLSDYQTSRVILYPNGK